MFLKISQNLQENTYARVSVLVKLQTSNSISQETLAEVITCEFSEIVRAPFLYVKKVFLKRLYVALSMYLHSLKEYTKYFLLSLFSSIDIRDNGLLYVPGEFCNFFVCHLEICTLNK